VAIQDLVDEWTVSNSLIIEGTLLTVLEQNHEPTVPNQHDEQGAEHEAALEPGLGALHGEDHASYLPPESALGGLLGALMRISPEESRARALLRFLGLVQQTPSAGTYSRLPRNFVRRVRVTRQGYLPLLAVSVPLMYLLSWISL
jgi:hypothetical protein